MKSLVLLGALLLASPASAADLVKCKKADGSLYVGTTPPEGCVTQGTIAANSSAPASAADAASQAAAIDSCKQAVKARFVSPGSAAFSEIDAKHTGGTRFDIAGLVDSQNRAGGLMRSVFICDSEYAGDNRWSTGIKYFGDGGKK